MHPDSAWRRLAAFFFIIAVSLPLAASAASPADARAAEAAQAQAERERSQPGNNAPFWRDVRDGEANAHQTTQVRGVEAGILVQSEGELWRQIRNGPITVYGGWFLVLVFVGIMAFYRLRGPIKMHGAPTGRLIHRFTPWERVLHWTTAIIWTALAATGIIMLFGRYVILPAVGHPVFSGFAHFSKALHNFLGPLFAVCTVAMFVTFVRDNLWRKRDWQWIRHFTGFLRGRNQSSEKYNAGEKVWFWLGVLLAGLAVAATGLVLDFPNFGQGRETMQFAHMLHSVAAIGFMALGLGHIYLGTIGMQGAYDAMRYGYVDEAWAKEHHDIWYRQVKAPAVRSPSGTVSGTAPASRGDAVQS
jgi:formate dehydrogenase subunit gamma